MILDILPARKILKEGGVPTYIYVYIYIYGVHCGEVVVQNKITVYNKGSRWKFEPFCRLISVKYHFHHYI